MNRTQYYKVAGHIFGITMPQSDGLWQYIHTSYSPFEVSSAPSTLFTVTVVDFICTKDMSVILKDPNPKEEEVKIDVYSTSLGYAFGMRTPLTDKQNCLLHISNDFSSAQITLSGNEFERMGGLDSAVILSFMLATARMDTVVMHSSVVVNNGKAYMFLGRSGTGKSTHSRLWLQAIAGTSLLNDDHPILRIDRQGNATVYGSPWSGKTPCYKNDSAPVGGIVRIRRAPQNRIKRLSPVESYASLLTSCSGMTWNRDLADGKDLTMQKIIANVPCWVLECLPDQEAAQLCASTIRKDKQCNE